MRKLIKKHFYTFGLFFILLVAFFIRTIELSEIPSGFHADESSFYINAKALAQTGADEDGNKFPLSLSSFIDPKPAIYSYLEIPFISTLENQVLAARLPSTILAVLSLYFTYLLIERFSNKKISLMTTLILSISPWHIVVSRGTQEVIISFLFLIISLYILVAYLLKNKPTHKTTVLSLSTFFITSFLSMYSYHSAKLLLPMLAFGILGYYFKKSKRYLKNSILILVSLIIAGAFSLLVQESGTRISEVGIFNDTTPQLQLMEKIFTSREKLPSYIINIFHNKFQSYSTAIIKEYLSYFSPDFLFLSGGKPNRYIVPNHGLLYLIEIPLILAGLYFGIKNKRKEIILFVGILLLSPIPSSLTTEETPSMIRSFPMIIGLAYFIATGILNLLQIKRLAFRYVVAILLIFFYTWHLLFFEIQYHIQSRFDEPWFRNSPYTDIAKDIKDIGSYYDEIHITSNLTPLYSYFVTEDLISIEELQSNAHLRNNENYTLGKFTFIKACDFTKIKPNILYVAETECYLKNTEFFDMEIVKSVTYQDGKKVYELLQLVK